jgi:hypothetical protein
MFTSSKHTGKVEARRRTIFIGTAKLRLIVALVVVLVAAIVAGSASAMTATEKQLAALNCMIKTGNFVGCCSAYGGYYYKIGNNEYCQFYDDPTGVRQVTSPITLTGQVQALP